MSAPLRLRAYRRYSVRDDADHLLLAVTMLDGETLTVRDAVDVPVPTHPAVRSELWAKAISKLKRELCDKAIDYGSPILDKRVEMCGDWSLSP